MVSQPVEPEVVADAEDMTVDSGGMSDSDGGMPPGYLVSATSADSDASVDEYGDRCSLEVGRLWTRWCRVYSRCWWISVSTIESVWMFTV